MMWEVAAGGAAFKGLHYGGFYKAIVVEGLRPELLPAMPQDYAALMQRVSDGSFRLSHCKHVLQPSAYARWQQQAQLCGCVTTP
jgi:hypothetical protein